MKKLLGSLALALLTASTSFAQTTWHVDAGAVPPGTGSVAQPFADLQFALAQPTTVNGDTLLVEPGTYVGPFDYLGKNVTVQSTQGAAVTILSGNLQQVSVVNFLNGEGAGAILDGFTVTAGRGTFIPTTGGPVLTEGGGIRCVQSAPTLTNLIVTQNYARRGGGIMLSASPALVSHCTLSFNAVSPTPYHENGQGGGIHSTDPNAVIEFCTFESNVSGSEGILDGGGGFYGRGTVRDSAFVGNRAAYGAGMHTSGSTIERCSFISNRVNADSFALGFGSGGGLAAFTNLPGWAPTTATDCWFEDNEAGVGGGVAGSYPTPSALTVLRGEFVGNRAIIKDYAACCHAGEGGGAYGADLIDCVVRQNAAHRGGGVFRCRVTASRIQGNSAEKSTAVGEQAGGGAHSSDLVDCEVLDNSVGVTPSLSSPLRGFGGGSVGGTALRTIYARNTAEYGGAGAGGTFEHCVFFGNTAWISGGSIAVMPSPLCVVCAPGPGVTVRNSISWGAVPNEFFEQGAAVATVTYSDIESGHAGIGNLSQNPLFFAPQSGDFHLKPGSPCIDAGDPTSPLDPDGSLPDMGAFPFDGSYCASPAEWCSGKPNSLGCVPEITYSGSPTATGSDDFYLTATNFLGANFGLLAWSRTPNSIPFQGGTLCLSGPFFRAGMQFATGTPGACDGTYTFHFSQSYRAAFGINTYETIYAQWFARDVLNPDGTGWSLSNAIEFTVCP